MSLDQARLFLDAVERTVALVQHTLADHSDPEAWLDQRVSSIRKDLARARADVELMTNRAQLILLKRSV